MHILTHTHTDTYTLAYTHTHTHTQIHICTPHTHTQRYMCTLTQDCSILSVAVAASHIQSSSQWELYMVSRCMKVFAHQFSKPSFKMVSYRKSGSESTYHGTSKQVQYCMGPTADSILGLFPDPSNAKGDGLGIRLTCY